VEESPRSGDPGDGLASSPGHAEGPRDLKESSAA
jgi:hypothetical protein